MNPFTLKVKQMEGKNQIDRYREKERETGRDRETSERYSDRDRETKRQ